MSRPVTFPERPSIGIQLYCPHCGTWCERTARDSLDKPVRKDGTLHWLVICPNRVCCGKNFTVPIHTAQWLRETSTCSNCQTASIPGRSLMAQDGIYKVVCPKCAINLEMCGWRPVALQHTTT